MGLKRAEDGRLGKEANGIGQATEVLNLVRAALRLRHRFCLVEVREKLLNFLANDFILFS